LDRDFGGDDDFFTRFEHLLMHLPLVLLSNHGGDVGFDAAGTQTLRMLLPVSDVKNNMRNEGRTMTRIDRTRRPRETPSLESAEGAAEPTRMT
jgi:hypothetical protein